MLAIKSIRFIKSIHSHVTPILMDYWRAPVPR
ncbi:hypothetical protein SPHV1_2270187 [Novosphingobium sp. KN65.2]|nr:hypothetical protein SPHV1_2270187 [Novosphingobium sp. KN65.2]